MLCNSVLVLALAVFGASAFVGTGFSSYGTFGPAHVSDVCRCTKTVVRPQIRTQITSIPTVQRFVRTEATPVIERIPYSVSRRVEAPGFLQGGAGVISGGVVANGGFGGAGVGLNGGFVY